MSSLPEIPTSLGVAVIGAGDMGARHAQHWHSAGASVRAVCDSNVTRAEAIAKPVAAQAVADPEALWEREDVQLVSICTPTFMHAPLAVAALQAGKHVLCEKPAALTLEDAYRMRDAAQAHGRELRIGFMRRFDPAYEQLRDFLGRMGNPVLAHATIAAGIRPKLLMHDAMANGGPIIDMCCHIFNLWGTMFGAEVTAVSARGYTFGSNKTELLSITHKALDSAHIMLEYASGAVGQLQVSWGLPAGIAASEYHSYMGPDGLLSVTWNSDMHFKNSLGNHHWQSSGQDPWEAQIHYFYRELCQAAPQRLASIDDGIYALRISLAVLEAAEQQRLVHPEEIAPPGLQVSR